MGWFSYTCPDHGVFKISLPKREKTSKCPLCGKESSGIIKLGSVQIKEKLDNGAMSRSVERLSNIEEILEERDEKFSVKQDYEDEE